MSKELPSQRPKAKLPRIYDFNFDDPKIEKPWRSNVEGLSDYFNYGFDEETWRLHVEKAKLYHSQLQFDRSDKSASGFTRTELPVECGGFGAPANGLLAETELFLSLTANPEKFWLSLDLTGEGDFRSSLQRIVSDHSNPYDPAANHGTFFFNRYFSRIKEFEEKNRLDLGQVLSKANSQRIRDRIEGRGLARPDAGFRQSQYTVRDEALGRRPNIGPGGPQMEGSKLVKRE